MGRLGDEVAVRRDGGELVSADGEELPGLWEHREDGVAEEKPEWFRVLVSRRSYFMMHYLKSLEHDFKSE